MKNLQLRRTAAIIGYTVLAAGLFSCSEMLPGDGSFYVKTVKEGFKYTDYQLVQIKGHGDTWVRDERGKYHVGDTVRLRTTHCR